MQFREIGQRAFPWQVWVVLGLLLFVAGCNRAGPTLAEEDERTFRRAESLRTENRPQEALAAYLDVIAKRGSAPLSHFHAAVIYMEAVGDPLAALYHFREHLTASPQSPYAEFIDDQMNRAQKMFLQSLPAQPLLEQGDRQDYSTRLENLQSTNLTLREELLSTRRELETTQGRLQQLEMALQSAQERATAATGQALPIVVASPSAAANESATPGTVTVREGDTLSRISSRVYNTPNRWSDIFQANRDQLPSPDALRPGQVLRIP